jgi:regulator of sirC expression with transglutaminase-like and TPR domain
MEVVEEFARLVGTGDPPLDRTLAAIAATGRRGVDVDALVARLDGLAETVPTGADAAVLCHTLFVDRGFTGNRDDYYDPANSLLDRVLDRRTGIPITLSVVGIEVGRRVGVGLVGVGMPGHFLLRDAADADAFHDAFDGGRPLDADGCRRLFRRLHGDADFSDGYLSPTPGLDVVVRVLNTLRAANLRRGDRDGLANVLRLQAELPGAGVAERRQLAGVLAAAGRFVEAAALYDRLVVEDPVREDDHAQAAARLRANLN